MKWNGFLGRVFHISSSLCCYRIDLGENKMMMMMAVVIR